MNFKTKLISILILFASIILMFSGGMYFVHHRQVALEQKDALISDLVVTVFERNILFNDYLSTKLERSKQQLISKNSDIGERIAEVLLIVTEKEDVSALENINENHTVITDGMERWFENGDDRTVAQISLKSQSTVSISKQLSDKYKADVMELRSASNTFLILFTIIGLALFVFLLNVTINILRGIAKLRRGTEVIAKGDIQFRFNVVSNDELGQVERSINTMTENLWKSVSLPRNILHSMKDSLFVIDISGCITEVNDSALEMLGYKKEELLGQPIDKVFTKPNL